MDELTRESQLQQALQTIHQYLSDSIAPLMAADSVTLLLDLAPQILAAEVIKWASAQGPGKSSSVSYSDYLFHALKKLHDMAGLKLISEGRLQPYFTQLAEAVLAHCPAADRTVLADALQRLGQTDTALTQAVAYVHRLPQPSSAFKASGEREEDLPELKHSAVLQRRLSILLQRLGEETPGFASATGATAEKQEGLVSQVVTTAAAAAQNDRDFRLLQERLRSLGIDSGTDKIFRVLSQSLPGWSVPLVPEAAAGGVPARQNTAVEAMRQIMNLAEDGWESSKRFQDMVQAAIEQFNTGSLARAATMFDLAASLATEGRLDADAVAGIRRGAHESLDLNRLRAFANKPEKHQLLRKVLNFFEPLNVEGLLDSLQLETKRDRRRLLLTLLETHGVPAREMAFKRLKELLARADLTKDWYFARNLICLQHRIPHPDDATRDEEIEAMRSLLVIENPAPLLREVVTGLGQIKDSKAEQILLEWAKRLGQHLLEPPPSGPDPGKWIGLLDRVIFTLAQYGTPDARRAVVDHGLYHGEELGDTLARLSYLSGQDFSADEAAVANLVKALRSKIPRKLFGVFLQKNEQALLHLIKALSSTPAPAVKQAFESIAARFPDRECGKAASRALKEFNTAQKRSEVGAECLLGDLELFSLPDLLQQLGSLQLTGTLTIKDLRGEQTGIITLAGGRVRSSSAGRLQGEQAVYQLLESPAEGAFAFQGRRDCSDQDPRDAPVLQDLKPLIQEGVRRYDELQRVRAIVPDSAVLTPTGAEPIPHPDEEDPALFVQVWRSVGSGATPEKCEAECLVDSYSVRSLLARWVEEAVLSLSGSS